MDIPYPYIFRLSLPFDTLLWCKDSTMAKGRPGIEISVLDTGLLETGSFAVPHR